MKSLVLAFVILLSNAVHAACPADRAPYKNRCWPGASVVEPCAAGEVYVAKAKACVEKNLCPPGFGLYNELCWHEATLIEQCRDGHIVGPICDDERMKLQRK